ncbi:MAG: FAD-dependent oxidoreductase [Bdellovibrionales bacterium]
MKDLKKPKVFDFGYVVMGTRFDTSSTASLRGLKRVRGGFIQTSAHQETSIPGLFAVGDCVNALAQVSVAIGQAALAATRIHHNLVFKHDEE